MATPTPLKGTDLIDCARANGPLGIEVAADRCGYGNNLDEFERELKQACKAIGIDIQGFDDLNKSAPSVPQGIEIAPDTPNEL